MLSVYLMVASFAGTHGFHWSQSTNNGSVVRACAGTDVPMSWRYTLDQFEDLVNIEWYFSPHYSNTSNCTSRWSSWVNRVHQSGAHDSDIEKMTSQEMTQFCPGGHVTSVQCQSVQGVPVREGQGLTCNVREGFACRAEVVAPAKCNDYKIRYFCRCFDAGSGEEEILLASYRPGEKFQLSSDSTQNMTHLGGSGQFRPGAEVTLHDVSAVDRGVYRVVVDYLEFESYRSAAVSLALDVDPQKICPGHHEDVQHTSRSTVKPQTSETTPAVPIG